MLSEPGDLNPNQPLQKLKEKERIDNVYRSSSIQIQQSRSRNSRDNYRDSQRQQSFGTSSSFGRQILVPLAFRTPPNGSPMDSHKFNESGLDNSLSSSFKNSLRHMHNQPALGDSSSVSSSATTPCSFSDKTFSNSLERDAFFSQMAPTIHLCCNDFETARKNEIDGNGFMWNPDAFESGGLSRSALSTDEAQYYAMDKVPVYDIL